MVRTAVSTALKTKTLGLASFSPGAAQPSALHLGRSLAGARPAHKGLERILYLLGALSLGLHSPCRTMCCSPNGVDKPVVSATISHDFGQIATQSECGNGMPRLHACPGNGYNAVRVRCRDTSRAKRRPVQSDIHMARASPAVARAAAMAQ